MELIRKCIFKTQFDKPYLLAPVLFCYPKIMCFPLCLLLGHFHTVITVLNDIKHTPHFHEF